MQAVKNIAGTSHRAMRKAIVKRNLLVRTAWPIIAAQDWLDAGFNVATATSWWNAGCYCHASARELSVAGLNPYRMALHTGTVLGHRHSNGTLTTADIIQAMAKYGED